MKPKTTVNDSRTTRSPEACIRKWVEKDLTAHAHRLAPAFEVDQHVACVRTLLEAGKYPILVGEPGVGKTAVVHELVRRAVLFDDVPSLRGRRVIQVSLARRVAELKYPYKMNVKFRKFVEQVLAAAEPLALYLTDLDVCYERSLEPLLATLAFKFDGPIICEGSAPTITAMFEEEPTLTQFYVTCEICEPDLKTAARIAHRWAEYTAARDGPKFTRQAVDEAVTLIHRFRTRSRLPHGALDLLGQTGAGRTDGKEVQAADVVHRFGTVHRTPRNLIDRTMPLDLDRLQAQFASRVLGQPEAVEAAVHTVGLIKSGLTDTRRPLGAYLFVGPTGVGKTHVAQLLAEYLFGSRDRMVRLNMADYPGAEDASVLFGCPWGATDDQRRGLLTIRMLEHPFGVVLLDEFEKTSPRVHDRFLQLLDEGAFINGEGQTVSCRSMIFIATSNAGEESRKALTFGFQAATTPSSCAPSLEQHFRPELLNRFERIVRFEPISASSARSIARLEIENVARRHGFAHRDLSLRVDDEVVEHVVAHGFDPQCGARSLRRCVEQEVVTALARLLVTRPGDRDREVSLAIHDHRVTAAWSAATDKTDTRPVRKTGAIPVRSADQVTSPQRRRTDRLARIGA